LGLGCEGFAGFAGFFVLVTGAYRDFAVLSFLLVFVTALRAGVSVTGAGVGWESSPNNAAQADDVVPTRF
jgi:hypothetical protein